MRRRSIWFWVCIVYLIATVTYNVYGLRHSYMFLDRNDQVALAINLGAKITAILYFYCSAKLREHICFRSRL